MLSSLILVLAFNISMVFSLPTKQLRYSLVLEKNFHSFNKESVLLKGTHLLITLSEAKGDDWDNTDYDWFNALMDISGQFHIGQTTMSFAQDGVLSMKHKESLTDDEKKASSVFSIKEGKLCHESQCQFTLCPEYDSKGIETGSFSIHHPRSCSSDCASKIPGVELAVMNQLGMAAKDFEAPEFLYNTGKRMFL